MKWVSTCAGSKIALMAVGLAAVLILEYFGAFVGMGYFCYDLFFRLRGPAEVFENISIVAVTESSLNQLGQWPINRRHWADLLNRLDQADVVGFDILMAEPSANDALLAQAVKRHGRVVFPAYITNDARMIQEGTFFSGLTTGHIHLEQDIDGVVRRVYHTLQISERTLPSFSSVLYEQATGREMNREAVRRGPEWSSPPVWQRDVRLIDYRGPPGSFPILPLHDVLAGKYPAEFFRGKIVLVGVTAEGLEAGVLSPFNQPRRHLSGVEAHAHILADLMDGRRIVPVATLPVWLVSLIIAGPLFFLLLRLDGWRVVAIWASAVACIFLISFLAFSQSSVWFNPIPCVVMLFVAFTLAYIIRTETSAMQLQRANQLWADSFDSAQEAIWLTDLGGAVLKHNKSAQNLLADNAISKVLTEAVQSRIKTASSADAGGEDAVSPDALKDEIIDDVSDRHFALRVIRRQSEGESSPGFIAVVQDISEQKRAAREKLALEAELLHAQKMEAIGTLAGGVAHDFNNILMGIQGYVSLLCLNTGEDDPRYDKLKKIETQVQSAAGLTRQLLGFARGGKYEVKPVDLNALVEKSSEVFARTRKEITLSAHYQDSLWMVMADAGQIEQVLLNLYINSWQAMPQGGDLYVRTENIHLQDAAVAGRGIPSGRYVRLSVTDTGSGMDEETCGRVFEPFFTTKEPGQGTGLGLASAYGIISNHGGFIDLQSELGKGSTFYIYLPAAEVSSNAQDLPPESVLLTGRETILVVDDEPMNATVMKEILESLGYRVLCAGSGQEALSIYLVKKEGIDLIILDMIMPGMGGGATFDAIRSIHPQAKIILASGYSLDGEARRILERGCGGFIQKPFRVSELSHIVRDVLSR
ncbi:MAG TPA: CHASE2 domain-containing protein [Smithellaceae bacterium]|nr:CHASE2 domain-containing protein [Smithellaceae bacterium]